MADMTVAIAFSLCALAMSLAFLTRTALSVVRVMSYVAMVVLGVYTLGVKVTAPITDASAEIIEIVAFGWMIVALLAVCVRGLYRMLTSRPATINGS